jgi:hemoglobin/transferrin/lactoferrin receptor protein
MRIRNKFFIFPLVITASASSLHATENQSAKVYNLNTVTVVATRTEQNIQDVPGQVSVIEADAPVVSGSSKVSDVLKTIPGLEFSGSPRRNGEEFSMRGYGSESIILMVDGKKQNFNSAHDGRFFLDPSLIKRAEVVRGATSASYGAGGLGGVIAFETKDAADFLEGDETKGAEISLGYESVNNEFLTSSTAYKIGNDYDIIANITRRRSFDIELGNGTELDSSDEIYSGLAKLTYSLSDESLLEFDYQGYFGNSKEPNNPQAVSGSTSTNKVDKDNINNQFGIAYEYNPDSQLIDLRTQVYYVNTEVEEEYVEATALNSAGDVLNRKIDTFGFNIDNSSRFEAGNHNHTLTYGFELIMDDQQGSDSSRTSRNGVPNAEARYYGGYIQDEIKFAGILGNEDSELYIIPAARYDYYESEADDPTITDDRESQFSPKIAANLRFNKNYNIFTSYAHGFRAPQLNELYASGTHFTIPAFGITNTFVPNPNLRPEKSVNFEFGGGVEFENLFQEKDKIRAKASRYFTEAEDYIEQTVVDPFSTTTCFPSAPFNNVTGCTTNFSNVDEASLWGYEVEVRYESRLFNAGITAAYVTGKDDNNGQYLETIHPLIFTSNFEFNLPEYDSVIGHFGKYSGQHDKVNNSSDERGGYAVHNLYYRYQPMQGKLEDFTFDLGIDNVLDKAYTETFASNYEAGRNFKIRVSYKW